MGTLVVTDPVMEVPVDPEVITVVSMLVSDVPIIVV